MPAEPRTELLSLPREYGSPEAPLAWEGVRARLEGAAHYWLATVRPDGRPHVVPLDGIWLDDCWYFGGSPEAVKHRNLQDDPRATLHLEDASQAVIVDGVCEWVFPQRVLATALSERSRAKYGYGPAPKTYEDGGVWCLRPRRALSWQQFPRDATRFVFETPAPA